MKWITERLEKLAKVDETKAKQLQQEYLERINKRKIERDLQISLELEYRYFRFNIIVNDYIWNTAVSFGWKLKDDTVVYAFALQSKNDNFSRPTARKIINKRFSIGDTYKVKRDKSMSINSIPLLLAMHYNGMKKYVGLVGGRPNYLKKIPIIVGSSFC